MKTKTRKHDDESSVEDVPESTHSNPLQHLSQDLIEVLESKAKQATESVLKSSAEKIRVYNSALSAAADSLAENKEKTSAKSIRKISQSIDETANCVAESSASDVVEYARRNTEVYPALALAGAAIAGFVIGRLLTTEPPSSTE